METDEWEIDYDQMSDDELMERCRAARVMLYATRDKDMEVFAFLSLFHPEMSDEEKRDFVRATKESE